MSESILDVEAMLAPLEAGEGAGEDPRLDTTPNAPYQKLRDARSEARAEERERDSVPADDSPPPTQWRDVLKLGAEILSKRGKDFEVAAFMTEALVRLNGLSGLGVGARLLEGMLDQHWDHGFPGPEEDLPDDEKMEGRGAPIGGLAGEGADGTVMQPLRRLALYRRPDGNPVSFHQWLQSEDVAGIAEEARRKARYAAGVIEMDKAREEAKQDGGGATLRNAVLSARAAGRLWTSLAARLDERFGRNAPSTRRVSELLAKIEQIGVSVLGPIPDPVDAAAAEAAQDAEALEGGGEGDAGGTGGGRRGVRTRDDMIKQIEEAADWFLRMEPHSPLAFTLTDAARRARMPLPDLLAEVLPDAAVRKAMLTILGIQVKDEAG